MSLTAEPPSSPEPQPPPPSAPPRGAPNLVRLEAALVVTAAVLALLFHLRLPSTLPSEQDYVALAARVASIAKPGDVVLLDPHWAERARLFVTQLPVLNLDRTPTREDLARYRRVLLVSLPDLPRSDPEAARAFLERSHYRAAGPVEPFGKLALSVFDNRRVETPSYDFTEQVAQARVYIRRPDGSEELCPLRGDRHPCPRAGWINVGAEVKEIAFKPYRCLWAHPAGMEPLVIEYANVTLGRELKVMGGIVGQIVFKRGSYTTTTMDIRIDGQRVGDLAAPAGSVGEHRRTIDTSKLAGTQHTVSFEIWAKNPDMRHFCFDAGVYP